MLVLLVQMLGHLQLQHEKQLVVKLQLLLIQGLGVGIGQADLHKVCSELTYLIKRLGSSFFKSLLN